MVFGASFRSDNNKIHLRRDNKRDLVNAVIELENRGFECVAPIKRQHEIYKDFMGKAHYFHGEWTMNSKTAVPYQEVEYYEVYMKRVD